MANPFLVLGGIAISVATAAFGILQVPGWVAAAQDAAATNDIAQVSAAQAAMVSERGSYAVSLVELSTSGSVKVTKSGGVGLYTSSNPAGDHYLVVTRSASGAFFARTSDSGQIGQGANIEAAVVAAGTTVTGPATARVTAKGAPLPSALQLFDIVHTNLHHDPNGTRSAAWVLWNGTSNLNVTRANVTSDWSKSRSAHRLRWQTVSSDTGYFGTYVGPHVPADTKVTVRFRVVANQPITLLPMKVIEPHQGAKITSSHTANATLTAGQPTEVWMTLRTPAAYDQHLRVAFDIRGHQAGLEVELSEADVYLGDYDPNRPWFSGSVAPDGLQSGWDGAEGTSVSHAYR